MFWRMFDNAFGLDLSDLSVKIVQLRNVSIIRKHPQFRVRDVRAAELPPGLIVNGELQQPEEIRKHIQRLIYGDPGKRPPLKGYWVVASIPETQGFIKLIHTETPAAALAKADILALGRQHIPFEEEGYYLDWQLIPEEKPDGQTKTAILVGATPQPIADSYTYLLESLGLGVIALEIEAVAVARAMITKGKAYGEEARLVLDIGATGTGAIVFDDDMIQFSTSLPFSGELVTTALSQKLNISHDEAETKKRQNGIEFNKSAIWPLIADMVDRLADDIKKTMDFYYAHFPHAHRITHITMSGGVAHTAGLGEVLSTKLGIEAKPGNPWKNVSSKITPDPAGANWGFATAIGLALRAADNPFRTHDSV